MSIRSTSLKGSNSCFFKRSKEVHLSEGNSDDSIKRIIFQREVIKNKYRALDLRGREEETKDAISLLSIGTPREDVPDELLHVFDSVKSILRADGRFDLRTGGFDETKAFVITQRAARRKYIECLVPSIYETFFFDTKKSAELNGDAVCKTILRYLDDEARSLIVPDELELDLFGEAVRVRPDLLDIDPRNRKVEAIKLRTGKPDCSEKGRTRDHNILNNKELYALFAYARAIAKKKGWDEDCACGSYYFLRKDGDRSTIGHLEPGYFEPHAKHIATLQATPTRTVEKIDEIYKDQFDAFVIGEECSADDCKNCEWYELCEFAEAPLKTDVERREKSLDDITLSPAQEKVVQHRKGVMRCNAGAGSGKTTVVALNTAFMLAEGIDPKEILLITFSNAGAGEMKDRTWSYSKGLGIGYEKTPEEIAAEIAKDPTAEIILRSIMVNGNERDFSDLTIVTFNEFGQNILNTEFKTLGFTAPPRPIDATERSSIIAKLLDDHTIPGLFYNDINLKIKNFKGARHVTEEAFRIIKRDRLSVYNENELRYSLSSMASSISDVRAYRALLELYEEYDETLRSRNLIEFQDQESLLFDLLDIDPYYFDKMGYKHIIIDEFQDTSKNQMKIIKTLLDVAGFESLLVVGDDSQAIYGWRDADSSNIIEFESRIGMSVEDVNLVENHRSTPEILEFANSINALNSHRVEKDLVATRPSGKPVVVKGFHKVEKEYDYIVNVVKEKIDEGHAPEDIAILTRQKSEVVKIAGKLSEAGIESSLQAPQKMLENSRVQGICALARAYEDIAATKYVAIFMNCIEDGKLCNKTDEEIAEVISEGQQIIRDMWYLVEPRKVTAFRNLVDEIADDDDIAIALADRLNRFVTVADMISYIKDFIRFDGEELRREGLYSGVVLSTAHSSKGLEWPVIINSITNYDRKDGMSDAEREEQRRLLFVSATRARDELYITGQIKLSGTAEEGFVVNRFVDEAATVANQPLDYFDEEGKAERAAKRKARIAKVKEERENKKKETK